MLIMICKVPTKHYCDVKENQNKLLKMLLKNLVHQTLKARRYISEAKGYHYIFIVP